MPTAVAVAANLGFSMALSFVWAIELPIRPNTAAPVVFAFCKSHHKSSHNLVLKMLVGVSGVSSMVIGLVYFAIMASDYFKLANPSITTCKGIDTLDFNEALTSSHIIK